MQGSKVTDVERQRILRMLSTTPISATAKTLGFSRNTVKKILKESEKKSKTGIDL